MSVPENYRPEWCGEHLWEIVPCNKCRVAELEGIQEKYEALESAALTAVRHLQHKRAGQCANEIAADLLAVIDGREVEG